MNEAVFTDIHSDMSCSWPRVAKEHNITGLELARLDRRCREGLLGSRARHIDTQLVVHEEDQPTAVETRRVRATVAIGRSNQRLCQLRNLFAWWRGAGSPFGTWW
jgi:hypothetical protein